MKTRLFKILSGLLIAFYISTLFLSGAVLARSTPAKSEPKRGVNPQTGRLSFIGGGDPIFVAGVSEAKGLSMQDRAHGMADVYGSEFGLKNPSQDLKPVKAQKDSNGKTIVRFQQMYRDVPVYAGEMLVNTNGNGELLSISGEVSPDLTLSTKPEVTAQQARKASLEEIASLYQMDARDLNASDPELWIFDESLLQASTRPPELVWRMEVRASDFTQPIRELVMVNAQTGMVSWHINQVDSEGDQQSQPAIPLAAASPIQYMDLVVDEVRGVLYGADKSGNKIDVISMTDLSVLSSFTLSSGALPTGIDLSPNGNELAVAQSGLSRVKFINLSDGSLSEIPVALSGTNTKATDVVYGRLGVLYALSSSGLHVIDTTQSPHAEDGSQYIAGNSSSYSERFGAISSDKNSLFYITGTCCSGYNSLYEYDISAGLAKPVETNHTYLTGSGSRTNLRLSLIDDSTLITSFGTVYNTTTFTPLAKNGQIASPAIAIPGHSFYVTSYDTTSGQDSLYFFERQSSYRISSLSTGVSGTPGALAATSDGSVLFASSTGGMTKFSIGDTAPGTAGGLPQSLKQYRDFAFDLARGVIYGTDASNRVDVLDQNTGAVVNSFLLPNGANPMGVDLSPDGSELAVAMNGLEAILFMDPQTGAEIARVTPRLDLSIYYQNQPYDVIYGRTGRLYSDGYPSSTDYLHAIDTVNHAWIARSVFPEYLDTATELAITSDKKYIYASGTNFPNYLYVFDVQTDVVRRLYANALDLSYAGNKFTILPDGSKVFTSRGEVRSGNLVERIGTLEAGAGQQIKYVPGLNLLVQSASVTGGDLLRFLSPVDYRLLSTYGPIPNGPIAEMESAPDGSRLFININNTVQMLRLDPSLPTSIAMQSGSGQTVQVSTPFQNPLKVKVSNILGNPVPNVAITFQGPSTGASLIFADSQTNMTTVTTDGNGIATSPLFSSNSAAGSYSVQAVVSGIGISVAIPLQNLAAVSCTIVNGTSPATVFLPYKQYRCQTTGSGVAGGDFNGDGRRDIALSTSNGALLIFLQDANGNLSTQPRVYAGSGSSALAAGDLNHDGRDDLVFSNGTGIGLYLQKSDGTFPYPVAYSTGSTAGTLAVGDVNNDSLADIVVAVASNSIGVFTQQQDGTLNPMVLYPSLGSGEIEIGDVNGDGLNDVVSMSGQTSGQLQIFAQSNGILSPYSSVGLTGCSSSCGGSGIGIGDVTGDGRADIVMSYGGNRPNSYIAVFPQGSNGNILPPTSYASYDIPGPVEVADVDSDHLADVILLHNGWNRAGVYPQLSSGLLGAEDLYQIPYKSWYSLLGLSVGDINADGLPDLTIGDDSGLVVLYRNTTIPPTPTITPTYTPTYTPGPTFTPSPTLTPGPGPSRTPRPSATAGPSPTPVPPFSTGNRRTYSASGGSSLPGTLLCDQSQASCTNGADFDADAAHRYAADTFVFYNTHHKRNSFDNQGGTILSTVHLGIGYQNAFWNGVQVVYGDNMAADDVVGHEISHGVTEYSSNLIYYGQSGAINESFSDVWGEFIDQTNGLGNDTQSVKWLMGEDTVMGAIRSMSNPPDYGNPDRMSSPYFYTGSYDNGGVHINSGVNNKAAYLLVEGGAFNGRYISAIGMNKTAAVYYEAQANLLTAGANYSDLYYALLQACQNLTGGAEGITANDCLQVQLAAEAVEMISVPVPTPTAPPTDTFTPTASPTPTVTFTFTSTYTPTRTFTPSPTFTKTRTPTATKKSGPTKPTSTPTLKSTAVPSRTPRKSSFADVPSGYVYFDDIEILYANGLTGGCSTSPLSFCPDQIMNRGQAAVFMLRGNFGNSFVPDPATHLFQDDWSKGAWAESWAEAMKNNGLSSGCLASPLKYCPWDQIPREQAVIFALRLKYGIDYQPPAATGTLFADMTDASFYTTAWAEQAYREGLLPSCGTSGNQPMICPKALVSRGLAAHMIVRAKDLTMP